MMAMEMIRRRRRKPTERESIRSSEGERETEKERKMMNESRREIRLDRKWMQKWLHNRFTVRMDLRLKGCYWHDYNCRYLHDGLRNSSSVDVHKRIVDTGSSSIGSILPPPWIPHFCRLYNTGWSCLPRASYNRWQRFRADLVGYNQVLCLPAALLSHTRDMKRLPRRSLLAFRCMARRRHESIEVVEVDFVDRFLDTSGNARNRNDTLRRVETDSLAV